MFTDRRDFVFLDHTGLWRDEIREWVPGRIFDAHVHLGAPSSLGPFSPERAALPLSTFSGLTIEELEAIYRDLFSGKEIAGLCAFGFPLREVDLPAANAYVAGLAEANPRLHGFLLADPFSTRSTIAAYESYLLRGIRFRGLKPYFDLLGKSNAETRMEEFVSRELLAFAAREDLVLMLHTAGNGMGEADNQVFIRGALERHPGLRIVLAHMGRYVEPGQFKSFLDSGVARLPSVFLDVSCANAPEVYRRALAEEYLHGKILFATDLPFGLLTGVEDGWTFITRDDYPWSDPLVQSMSTGRRKALTYNTWHVIKAIKDAMDHLGIRGEAARRLKEDIFLDNARRLMKGQGQIGPADPGHEKKSE